MKRKAAFLLTVFCLLLCFVLPISADDSLTPSGNLKLVDDITTEAQQIITVQSRGGNYYYIIIDRSGEEYNVHFLNAVDERDLFAIIGDEDELPICTCTEKCGEGHVDTDCAVCSVNVGSCTADEAPETESKKEQKENSGLLQMLLIFGILGLFAVSGFVYYRGKKKVPESEQKKPDYDEEDDDYPEEIEEAEKDEEEVPKEKDSASEKESETDMNDDETEEETEDEDGWHYLP